MLIGTAARGQREGKPDKAKAEAGIAAYIGGQPVTLAEVDAKALGTDMKLAQSLYEARQRALDQIIMERLLAEKATAEGTTLDALIAKRIAEKTVPVTDEEVEAFYNANRSRMRGQPLEAMSGRIREYLASQRSSTAEQQVLDELKKESDVRVTLEPPRVKVVTAANDPSWGPSSAKVTIVEYVDYQ
jgi:hypothetical protein